jgi:hypothetical protein
VLRGIGFGLAIALGGVAVWLIVTSTTQKRIEIGVLTGLWGLLLGAYSMFGSRRALSYGDPMLAERPLGAELELRSGPTDLERAEAAAERRAFQAGLEQLLHREIRTAVSLEVGELRSEIAALRSELLEKVGGQIRLERIETTRVIGSDLEALQEEVRQLKAVREAAAAAPAPSIVNLVATGSAEPAFTRVVPSAAAPLLQPEPEPAGESTAPIPPIREAAPLAPQPARWAPIGAEPESIAPGPGPVRATPQPAPEPAAAAPEPALPKPAPEPAADPAGEPAAAPVAAATEPPEDPFAGLPRIRPFTEFDLDPIEPAAAPSSPQQTASRAGRTAPGLRHAATADEPPAAAPPPAGRRAAAASTPRRHRRAEDSDAGQELLAKLLAREG